MHKIRWLMHWIDLSNEWIGRVSSSAVILFMVILTIEVTLRYVFDRPTIWAWDVATQLSGAFALVGGAYAFLHGDHIRVDILYNRFRPATKLIIDLIFSVFFFALCLVLIRHGGEIAWSSVIARETAMTLFAPPIYPLRVFFVAVSFLLLLQGIVKFIRDLSLVFAVEKRDE